MKIRILILAVLVAVAMAGYLLFLRIRPLLWDDTNVLFTATSPDGRWRCVVRDIDPNSHQVTAVYDIEDTTQPFPLNGAQFVEYNDSVAPNFEGTQFIWSGNKLTITGNRRLMTATFTERWQRWTSFELDRQLPPAGEHH